MLLRVDFNVPLDAQERITDDTRIRASLPTINALLERGARAIIICSHLGRPKGRVVEELRLEPVARRLSELLGREVHYIRQIVGPEVEKLVNEVEEGGIVLLENLRFHPGEEANDPEFARQLAKLADVFVNDAFGVAHRAHASTVGVTRFLPAVAGCLLEKEIKYLSEALERPERPFAALIGGAKIDDKIGLLERILEKVDFLLLGGGLASTFLKAKGIDVGKSLVGTDEKLPLAEAIMAGAHASEVKLFLPEDVVAAERFEPDAPARVLPADEIPPGWYIMDIGPRSVERFKEVLSKCKTVVWNGPMGVFEIERFRRGTEEIARFLAELGITVIVGGGSTAEAINELGLAEKLAHVSTGGGASLRMLEGEELPAIEALMDKR